LVEDEVVLRESIGFKTRELGRAEELAVSNRDLIIRRWHEYFD